MNITAPLDYERYAVLLNPLLIPDTGSVQTFRYNANVSPVLQTASTANHHKGNETNPQIGANNDVIENKNQIILRKSVPFSRPSPETGRGQNIDIWA